MFCSRTGGFAAIPVAGNASRFGMKDTRVVFMKGGIIFVFVATGVFFGGAGSNASVAGARSWDRAGAGRWS
jgi:hypothetical protein